MKKTTINLLAGATIALTFAACSSKSLTINHENELAEANKCQVLKYKEKEACYGKISDTNSYAMIRTAVKAGQRKNHTKALEYFTKAKNLGNYHANLGEAFIYFKGLGVKKDPTKAAMILEQAADKSPNSAFQLSRFYLKGDGVKADIPKGMKLLEQSANAGLYSSQKKLYTIYKNGEFGMTKDLEKANAWKKMYSEGKRKYFLEAYKY